MHSPECKQGAMLEGTSVWEGKQLNAQVILFFNRGDAEHVQEYLKIACHQESCPMLELSGVELHG